MVYRYKERITQTPAIPPLNREKLKQEEIKDSLDEGFCLKRSGTVVRSVKNSSTAQARMWTPLAPPICTDRPEANVQCSYSSRKILIFAEV